MDYSTPSGLRMCCYNNPYRRDFADPEVLHCVYRNALEGSRLIAFFEIILSTLKGLNKIIRKKKGTTSVIPFLIRLLFLSADDRALREHVHDQFRLVLLRELLKLHQ